MTQQQQHTIRIFLASPGDTRPARRAVADVVDTINRDPLLQPRLRLELLRWDDPAKPVPCSFLRNPQHAVNRYTGDVAGCELVVALFRHHFGSPLPEADFGVSPDGDAWTGTEWELHRAVQAAQAGQVHEVLVYRDLSAFTIDGAAPADQADAAYAQFRRVQQFFAACRDPATLAIVRGVNEHQGPAAFRAAFEPRLKA